MLEFGAFLSSLTLRLMTQRMIDQHEGSHRFHHDDRARQHAGIMTAAGFDGRILQRNIDGVLLPHDRGDRFEGDSKINRLAVANAPLDPTGTIGDGVNFLGPSAESIVVLRARQENAPEA